MNSKISLTKADLEKKLHQQLEYIQRSAELFDAGHEDEAIRLAVPIRVLVHQTKHSHSLLDQLGMKGVKFFDSSFVLIRESLVPHSGLVFMDGAEAKFIPPLDMAGLEFRKVDFEDWWNGNVFRDSNDNLYTRKNLILTAADQDGGAHVDPALEHIYEGLLRKNTHGWNSKDQDGKDVFWSPVYPSIRQIAHEVLKTLIDGYGKQTCYAGPMLVGGVSVSNDPPPWAAYMQAKGKNKIQRNGPCHCGSAKKYKACCYLTKNT
ncbi:YecA family protein [Fundidesulfovibrio soli]|uniref:YecA family protein n=1 Tax=Fundidesulfovibrio soli TaxID=2922716 RepID=UPI001FAFBE6D|nr:SEC-C metal-binding domain-containing protein [Fundidesulfovibrio soli]